MEATPAFLWLADREDLKRSSNRVRLRVALPTFLVILISITGFVIIALNYFLSASSLRFVAQNYIHEVSRHALEKTFSHLTPAAKIVALNAAVLAPGAEADRYVENFNTVTLNEIQSYPQIALVYFGDEQGNFWMNAREPSGAVSLQMVRRMDDSEASREALTKALALPRTKDEERRVVADMIQPYIRTTWWNRNSTGDVIGAEEDTSYPYDPRLRPWFQKAKSRRAVTWTDAYLFSSSGRLYASGKPGLTVSAPVIGPGGQVVGVAGVDIVLEEISNFLRRLQVEEHGRAFIITAEGRTIALREYKDLITRRDGQVQLNHIEAISDRAVVDSFQALHKTLGSCPYDPLMMASESMFSFSSQGHQYFGYYQPFPKELGLDWYIGIVVPESDFIGKVNRNIYISVGASMILVLFVIALSFYFTTQVTSPINRVAQEAQRIRRFDLGDHGLIDSPFHEIDWLNHSFAGMHAGLRSFRKYVPADLVGYLLESGEEARLGGRDRELTIWFSDVADFTKISESMPPQALVEHMGEYMSEVSRIILSHEGTVDKYIGDAVMAFWNAPRSVENHALAACRSALLAQARLKELQERWRAVGRPELKVRVGINTGLVVVGNMGSEERLNYTAIGDAVNLASRLESLGKFYGTEIILGEATYLQAREHIEARRLDRVAVKGKSKSVFIYELVGLKGQVDDETLRFVNSCEVALETYFTRQWKIAAQLFHAAAKSRPTDVTARLFLKRAMHYMKSPPPAEWDGTFIMTSK